MDGIQRASFWVASLLTRRRADTDAAKPMMLLRVSLVYDLDLEDEVEYNGINIVLVKSSLSTKRGKDQVVEDSSPQAEEEEEETTIPTSATMSTVGPKKQPLLPVLPNRSADDCGRLAAAPMAMTVAASS